MAAALLVAVRAECADGRAEGQGRGCEVQHSRRKRSSLSFPPNSTMRWDLTWVVPVYPVLTATPSFYTLDLQIYYVMPSHTQLATLYGTLGRMGNDVDIDYDFLEEQRANQDRRNVYRFLASSIKT